MSTFLRLGRKLVGICLSCFDSLKIHINIHKLEKKFNELGKIVGSGERGEIFKHVESPFYQNTSLVNFRFMFFLFYFIK